MNVQDWLGENNQLGVDIWTKKYQHNNESFDEWLDRVSGSNENVKQLIREKKFLFGGRILANRGITKDGTKVTYSNCYVTTTDDSIEDIYETCKKLARTYSYGGGVGLDISKLSPKGARVNNAAKTTSGAVSFMDTFSQVTNQIGQMGRRGALMLSIDCKHPDLEDFISIKSDLNKVNYANISVRISNDFMHAVLNNDDWELKFTRRNTGEVISKTVKAKDVFHSIAKGNWDMAEPGMLFWDTIKDWNLLANTPNFEYAGVNPCLVGETLISTTHGDVPIKDLVGKRPYVYCMDDVGNITIRQASKVWKTRENAQVVAVETSRGVLKCTPDHLIHTQNRGWVPAAELVNGDRLTGLNRTMKDEKHVAVGLSGSTYVPEHRLVASAYYDITGKDVHHRDGDTLNNRIDNLEVLEHSEHSRRTNIGRNIEVLRDEKGRYVAKPVKKKRDSFNQGGEVGVNWRVISVTWLDHPEDVYDMTVPGVHNFVANRIVVHNCAEEPLPAGGSCLLGSINLAEFVDTDGKIDYVSLADTVSIATIALNEVLDEGLPLHPLEEQRQSVADWRQIGLGVMGIADMLIKMGIRYGSHQSIELCKNISNFILNHALVASARIAQEKGAYKYYNYDCVSSTDFYEQNVMQSVDEIIRQYGLRNSQLLTIAPTGTLSTMIGVSGGVEPIFANSYERKTQSLHGKDVYYKVYTPIVQKYLEEHNLTDDSELPEYFVTAQNLNYLERITMQAAWQHSIDASISSTINVPNSFTVEDVENLYIEAWKHGLKGVTIFRDGCRRAGVLTTNDTKEDSNEKDSNNKSTELPRGHVINASDNLVGKKRKLVTGCGSLHCEAFFDPVTGDLMETFLSKGSSGGCNNFMIGLSRMISLAARAGCNIESIVDQLDSCGICPAYAVRRATKRDTSKGSCCPMAVGNALLDMWHEMQNEIKDAKEEIYTKEAVLFTNNEPAITINIELCPECGAPLIHEGGCVSCKNCSWSKCN